MSIMRKVINTSSMRMAQKITRSAVPATTQFSTLAGKERGEETAYFRAQEADRKAAIRADLDRILALEDGHEDKEELMNMMEEQKAPASMISKLGLDDWKWALPAGLFIGIPIVNLEVVVLDAEFQLAASFILFCSTMYTNVGPMIYKSLYDEGQEIFKDLQKVDEVLESQIKYAIEQNEMALHVEDDFKSMYAVEDQITIAQAEMLTAKEAHAYRDAVVRKLDSLHAMEEAAVSSIRARMVNRVKANVINTFTDDKKMKEDALTAAMAVLAGGGKSMGKDIVGAAFTNSIKAYKEAYSKQAPGADEILNQLEKDMAAVATAPVPEGAGGNVYAL